MSAVRYARTWRGGANVLLSACLGHEVAGGQPAFTTETEMEKVPSRYGSCADAVDVAAVECGGNGNSDSTE